MARPSRPRLRPRDASVYGRKPRPVDNHKRRSPRCIAVAEGRHAYLRKFPAVPSGTGAFPGSLRAASRGPWGWQAVAQTRHASRVAPRCACVSGSPTRPTLGVRQACRTAMRLTEASDGRAARGQRGVTLGAPLRVLELPGGQSSGDFLHTGLIGPVLPFPISLGEPFVNGQLIETELPENETPPGGRACVEGVGSFS